MLAMLTEEVSRTDADGLAFETGGNSDEISALKVLVLLNVFRIWLMDRRAGAGVLRQGPQ